mgnify:FL=1|tara:strand:+ start:316 stop:1356 length:1041 start_codon:yes stop_codon:yes gene_type:complete
MAASLKSKYQGKGMTGLANVGNTCYMNSLLQILSHTYELSDFLAEKTYENRLNKKPDSVLLIEWDKLREMMWSQNCTIAPWGFVKAVQKVSALKGIELFTGYSQNDIQEYLLFLIDAFHNSISREVDMTITGSVKNDRDIMAKECYKMMTNMFSKDYSEIVKLFYGIHVSVIQDVNTGEHLSVRPEPFFVLSVPLPEGNRVLTINQCLDEYCKLERMEGDNAWYNEDKDIKQDIDKGMVFWSLPSILIVHLKRWNWQGRKDGRMVATELDSVDFTKYIHGYNKSSYIYELYGVCNHSGGSMGGHYTANIRVANNEWFNFNDQSITKINQNQIVSPQAYCLFYRKKK